MTSAIEGPSRPNAGAGSDNAVAGNIVKRGFRGRERGREPSGEMNGK